MCPPSALKLPEELEDIACIEDRRLDKQSLRAEKQGAGERSTLQQHESLTKEEALEALRRIRDERGQLEARRRSLREEHALLEECWKRLRAERARVGHSSKHRDASPPPSEACLLNTASSGSSALQAAGACAPAASLVNSTDPSAHLSSPGCTTASCEISAQIMAKPRARSGAAEDPLRAAAAVVEAGTGSPKNGHLDSR